MWWNMSCGPRGETWLCNHYCDSRQSAWHDPPGTAPSCSISFITRRQQNVWVNKAMTVCGDGTSTDQWSMKLLSHGNYIKYPWTLHDLHPGSCLSPTLMCICKLHLPFIYTHGTFNCCLISTGRPTMVTNYWTNKHVCTLFSDSCRSHSFRGFHLHMVFAKNLTFITCWYHLMVTVICSAC